MTSRTDSTTNFITAGGVAIDVTSTDVIAEAAVDDLIDRLGHERGAL